MVSYTEVIGTRIRKKIDPYLQKQNEREREIHEKNNVSVGVFLSATPLIIVTSLATCPPTLQ